MDRILIQALLDAVERGEPVVLATVIDTARSVPRHAGSKMLVFADGSTLGTIGGGEMEARVVSEALAALRDGKPRLLHYQLVDPRSGDPGICGGEVDLYLEPHMPTPTLFVIGCGHVGKAVIELAHWLGFRTVAYDDRPEIADSDDLPRADVVLSGPITLALESSPISPETHVVLLTRNMKVDLELLPVLLATHARTIGVMGSKRRWETTREELRNRGIDTSRLDRVLSPIGVELQAETPQEIALSVLAQIIGIRRGAL